MPETTVVSGPSPSSNTGLNGEVIGWFDGGAGASGDMLLGALIGAGVPLDVPTAAIDALGVGVHLRTESVRRGALAALKVHVEVPQTRTLRHLAEIVTLLASLDDEARTLATAIFERLARAEADVHGIGPDEVHFHEVGALDSIADIVGTAAAVVHLGLDRIVCSTLSLGSGTARSEHGPIPVPVPAVLALVEGIAPVRAGPAPFESTTPTGAAIMVEIADAWGPMPPMTVAATGVGAGTKDSPDVTNAVRLVVGEPVEP